MVVSIVIANFMVSKVLIDQGSSTYILYWKTFQRLKISPATIQPHYGLLLGFTGEKVETRGYVDLMTTVGQGKLSQSFTIRYLILDTDTSCFALIGKKTIHFPIWFLFLQFLTNIFKGNETPESATGHQVFKIKME